MRGLEAYHFMSIVNIDGEIDFAPFQSTTSTIHLTHKTRKSICRFGPSSFSQKWKVPKTGFYTPTAVNFVVTPHISEKAGIMASIRLVDESDMSPTRVLYQSQSFNLGHGMTLEGSQLPFCLPVGEYPILFEVTVQRSQFLATRTLFSTSLDWQLMYSPTPLSRVKSVFATAHVPVQEACPQFKLVKAVESKVPRAKGGKPKSVQSKISGGGTPAGVVPGSFVGPLRLEVEKLV